LKRTAATVILLVAMPSLCLAIGSTFPQKRVVLESAPFVRADDNWTPAPQDIEKALSAIAAFLKDPGKHHDTITEWNTDLEYAKGELRSIRKHFPEYGVQFLGIVIGDKKKIHCNFGPAKEVGNDYMLVLDGGFWYWRIVYDMETGKLTNLNINGYG